MSPAAAILIPLAAARAGVEPLDAGVVDVSTWLEPHATSITSDAPRTSAAERGGRSDIRRLLTGASPRHTSIARQSTRAVGATPRTSHIHVRNERITSRKSSSSNRTVLGPVLSVPGGRLATSAIA